jgi:preprotein translocase subunit SecE
LSYRMVNLPKFADFLIAVEAEMNKVSWPTRGELFRSSVVVIVTIFALAVILYFFDFFWGAFFTFTGILSSG